MLEQILGHIHNWFRVGVYPGEYAIQDGGITLPFLKDCQYFRIIGSVFNDGLHKYGPDMEMLTDETFNGAVWALAIPKTVITLADEMSDWEAENGKAASGVYQSESFGGYQYSKQTGANGGQITVFDVFSKRLRPYRRLREV